MTLVNSTTNIEVFNFENQNVRTLVDERGDAWFVAKDVCTVLGYANASKAIADHVDTEDKLNNESLSSLGQRGGWLINESGLYSLILRAQIASARKFKRWITHEVLPQIRRTGGYIPQAESESETLARAVLIAQKTIELKDSLIAEQQAKLEAQAPKVVWAKAVSASKHSVQVGTLARILRQNGIDTGRDRMFEYLRSHGYLIKTKGMEWNAPTQRSLELGLFTRKQRTIVNPDESTKCVFTTLVTPKGQEYFINKFLGESQQLTLEFEEVE